jgi:glucan biosynthesis protein
MIALLSLMGTELSAFTVVAEAQDIARPAGIVGFDQVVEFARRTAARPYKPSPEMPAGLKDMTYDLYKMISFDVKKPIWLNQSDQSGWRPSIAATSIRIRSA